MNSLHIWIKHPLLHIKIVLSIYTAPSKSRLLLSDWVLVKYTELPCATFLVWAIEASAISFSDEPCAFPALWGPLRCIDLHTHSLWDWVREDSRSQHSIRWHHHCLNSQKERQPKHLIEPWLHLGWQLFSWQSILIRCTRTRDGLYYYPSPCCLRDLVHRDKGVLFRQTEHLGGCFMLLNEVNRWLKRGVRVRWRHSGFSWRNEFLFRSTWTFYLMHAVLTGHSLVLVQRNPNSRLHSLHHTFFSSFILSPPSRCSCYPLSTIYI